MRTIIATVNLTESGSMSRLVYTDDTTSNRHDTLSTYGAPWIGEFDDSDSFRVAMGEYVTKTAQEAHDAIRGYKSELGACHGFRLAYHSPGHNLYVWEIDFDTISTSETDLTAPTQAQ